MLTFSVNPNIHTCMAILLPEVQAGLSETGREYLSILIEKSLYGPINVSGGKTVERFGQAIKRNLRINSYKGSLAIVDDRDSEMVRFGVSNPCIWNKTSEEPKADSIERILMREYYQKVWNELHEKLLIESGATIVKLISKVLNGYSEWQKNKAVNKLVKVMNECQQIDLLIALAQDSELMSACAGADEVGKKVL